jgi:hypothetical protein
MKKLLILLLIFLFSISLRLWNLNKMGRTWDEDYYLLQGFRMVELLEKGDFNNSFFYVRYDHPQLVKYLYGITAHFDVEKIVHGEPVLRYDLTYSRILSSILFCLGIVVVILIGWKVFSLDIGIYSGIILSMLPFSLGLSQLVTTESLKIFIYPLAIYSYIFLIEKISWRNIVLSGLITGIALQAKQSDFLLIPLLCMMFFFQYIRLKKKEKFSFAKNRIKVIFFVFLISILTFILIWPEILIHLKEIYAVYTSGVWGVHFSSKIWQITLSPPEVFFGRLMLTPIFYYVVYFFITIPLLILCIFFIGARNIIKNININSLLIIFWFIIPFSLSVYSWRQNGLRYIIEIYPAIAIISAVGFETIVKKITKNILHKLLLFVPVVIYLSIILWQIKPYYLDYFNELVGGVNTVYKYNLFQTGWWGQGQREAGLYLKNNAALGSTVGLAISPDHTFLKFDGLKYSTWSAKFKYDFVVVNNYHVIRDKFNNSLIKEVYTPVFFVKADKAILVTVYKRK